MNKTTLGFFRANTKMTIKGLLLLFALLLMNTQTSWGQTPIIPKLYLTAKNSPSGNAGWTFVNATINNSSTDYWKMVTASAGSVVTSPVMDFSGYTGITIKVVTSSFGTIVSNSDYLKLEYFNGTSWSQVAFGNTATAFGSNINLPYSYSGSKIRLTATNATGTAGARLTSVLINGIVTTPTSTTWNGTSWTNGLPSAAVEAVIDGTYNTNIGGDQSSFTAKKLTVNSGKSLTINSGTNLTIQNEVVNKGTLVVENNANLIQINDVSNTGNIVVKRDSNPLYRLDYALWSSPVQNQNLLEFSPLTSVVASPPSSRFYTYDSAINSYSTIADPSAASFLKGLGYLIRMPNEDPSNLGGGSAYVLGTASLNYNGVFTGVPNNGEVSLSVTNNTYNAIGNPYPSTIKADDFIAANAITEPLYFWRKVNNVDQKTNTTTSYATYTKAGGTGTTAANTVGGSTIVPSGVIQVGQGFITKSTSTTLKFTNSMRIVNNDNQILRTKNTVDKNRIWLNLTNSAGVFSQMMVAYMTGATQDIDLGIDGKPFNDATTALNSYVNNEEFVIQARALPFDPTDVVPLAFKTNTAGSFTIAIDYLDGLFASGQDIYLMDSKTGEETNLRTTPYTFTTVAGVDNARFSLKYQKTLNVKTNSFNEDSVSVYKNGGILYVNATAVIASIKVFDIQGSLVAEQNKLSTTSASIDNLKYSQQVLIVKITSKDGKTVVKKVIN